MARWMVAAKKADFDGIARKYHISPVLARIMRNRDVISDEEIEKFLYSRLEDLREPLLLKDLDKAAGIILEKVREGKSIRIIGDYDVDGICATFILLSGIRHIGGRVDTVIPHRMKDGYGLNDNLIKAAADEGIDTIVTCDNGIAAAPQIRLAKEKNMTIVVTDHHEVPFEEKEGGRVYLLPEADAVVDPKRPDCQYPFKQICGAVVAAKLIQVLFALCPLKAGMQGQESPAGGKEAASHANALLCEGLSWQEDILEQVKGARERQAIYEDMLSFGALATVCDVMELRDENRIIVKEGLKRMAKTRNLGLKALLMANEIEDRELSPYHVGFIIGPCMNATGRLDTAERALTLFEAKDWKEAVTIAQDLKSLNDSRKEMTEAGVMEAIEAVENTHIGKDRVLVVYLPECHESLAGIIAGRVREKYGKPAFVLTRGEEGVKGSGRSIEAYHMYEEMTACKELFTRYGGHKMAAGLSLAGEEAVEEFRKKLNENCTLTEEDFEEVLHIDVPMPLSYVNKQFIKELDLLAPFGVGNPKPVFARKGISLLSGRRMGKIRKIGKYRIADEDGRCFEMIHFGSLEQFEAFLEQRFGGETVDRLYDDGLREKEAVISIAYYPDLNSFGGRETIQIVMQNYC